MRKLTRIAKSLTSFILAAAFLISNLSGIAAFAAENDLSPSSIQIIATSTESDEPRKFDGYWSGSDFYLAAEDYAKITRYSYEEGSNAVRFKLGMKDILIQKGSGTMQILALRYQGKISRIVSMNGQTYLPMSELLPWLNVTVEQDDETAALRITSDSNSLWEYVGDTANYKFNLYQQMQGFTGGTTSLKAIMVTDVVSHVRWDAMFKSAIDTDISRYDTTIYQDVFYEYSKELFDPDLGYMLADKTATVWDTAQKINKKLDSVEEMFDIDENAIILKLDDVLREQYLTEQFGSAVGFLRQFSELRKAITKLSPVHPFLMAALDIQTNQIDPINTLLAEFSLTASCRVNDSVEGKDEAQTNIKTILQSVVETSSDAIEDTPSSSEETAPSEETSAESEVVEEPSKEESVPTAQEIEKLYRDFVAQNFSGNYVALKADVTHDGIADLIVVHYEDVEGWDGAYHQNGYIYTWQPSGIKLLKQEYGGTAHNYPGLLWYLRKLDNGMYNLIVIDDRIRQMTNFATISEISLTNDGAEITERAVEKFGTAQGEYVTDEELDAFWARENQINSEMIDTSPLNKNIDPAIVLCRGNT